SHGITRRRAPLADLSATRIGGRPPPWNMPKQKSAPGSSKTCSVVSNTVCIHEAAGLASRKGKARRYRLQRRRRRTLRRSLEFPRHVGGVYQQLTRLGRVGIVGAPQPTAILPLRAIH